MNARKWLNIAKTLFVTLAPLYVPIFLLIYFGFRIEPILASILFVQIYILVVQAEAMLRQSEWTRATYDATFGISADVRELGTVVTVTNFGDKPAYNFFVGLRNETEGKPLAHSRVSSDEPEVYVLMPGRRQAFHIDIRAEEFQKRRIFLTITYENVLGHVREVRAASFENSEEFFKLTFEERPGFLLRAYEDLMLYIRWHFVIRRWMKRRQKS